jgi:hypothetical protein
MKQIEITTLNDILTKVPVTSRKAFASDLLAWLELQDTLQARLGELEKALGCLGMVKAFDMKPGTMTWVDDGKTGLSGAEVHVQMGKPDA